MDGLPQFLTGWASCWPAGWVLAGAVVVALLIDTAFGELPSRWHPVAWIGKYLGWAGRSFVQRASMAPSAVADRAAFWRGALAWCAGAGCVTVLGIWLQQAALQLPGALAALCLGFLLKPMFAWRMLRAEVLGVERALGRSLEQGRERLGWLVSRDVSRLSESGVRESAIESLAENLNDSVVALLCCFVLLGLPGAMLYRFANTADAMWGYPGVHRGCNWQSAGKWAARADDVLSWAPARATALLLFLAAWLRVGAKQLPALRVLRLEAGRTASPNSGWPMAAMALLLEVRLGKPQAYTLNARGRTPIASDTQAALSHASRAVWLLALATPALVLSTAGSCCP